MSAVALSTFRSILALLRLFLVEFWTDIHQTDDVTYACAATFDVTVHVDDAGSSYSIPVPSLKFVGRPFGRYGAFSFAALIGLRDLDHVENDTQ